MKTLQCFINEKLQENNEMIIDEGLKDWIRKFAITSAVAASCLTGLAQTPQSFNNDSTIDHNKQKIEMTAQKKYDDVIQVEAISIKRNLAMSKAKQRAAAKYLKSGKKLKLLDIQEYYNNTTKQYKTIITLGHK